MSMPISYCVLRNSLDNNNWKSVHSDMRFNNLMGGSYIIFPCSCGKCKNFTKKESKIVKSHLAWDHPNNIPFIKKLFDKLCNHINKRCDS